MEGRLALYEFCYWKNPDEKPLVWSLFVGALPIMMESSREMPNAPSRKDAQQMIKLELKVKINIDATSINIGVDLLRLVELFVELLRLAR